MATENEKRAMTRPGICSGARPVQHLPLRAFFPPYLQTLLIFALSAGFALSSNTPATALTPTSLPGQDVIYSIEVQVEVTGQQKDEKDIKDWLQPVFQNDLQTCGSIITTTSAPTISTSTFTTTLKTNATDAATTVTTTTVMTQTSAGTSTTLNPVTSSTVNTTATPLTTTTSTVTSTTITTRTSVSASASASTATSTTLKPTTTESTTSTSAAPSRATTTTPTTTTSAASRTATTTITTATSPTKTKGTTETTLLTTTPMKASTTTSITKTTSLTTTLMKTSTTTSITKTTLSTTTPMKASRTTSITKTTLLTTTPMKTSTTTSITKTTLLTATPMKASTTARVTKTTLLTTTPMKASTTARVTKTTRPAPKIPRTTLRRTAGTVAPTTPAVVTNKEGGEVFTITIPKLTSPVMLAERNGPSNILERVPRKAREASTGEPGIFQGFELCCVNKTSIRRTTCLVTLTLKGRANPCCILQTLCTASQSSKSITVTGTKAERTSILPQTTNQCNSTLEDACVYSGKTGQTCDETSGYSFSSHNLTQCGTENKCNCLTHCSRTDAYYTFNTTTEKKEISSSQLSCLFSVAWPSACPTCPSPEIASKLKSNSIVCTRDIPQNCEVILEFSEAVPICPLAVAVATLLNPRGINMVGRITRAAICGKTDGNLLTSSHTVDVNLSPDDFCSHTEENKFNCQAKDRVIVLLNEQCAETTNTTAPVNATSAPLNTTAPVNATSTPFNESTGSSMAAANALLEMAKDASKLNSSQVDQLVSDLENLLSGPTVSQDLGNVSVQIVSSLVNGATLEAVDNSKNRIMGIADTVGLKLALTEASITRNDLITATLLSGALAISVLRADGTQFKGADFSISDPNDVQLGASGAKRAAGKGSPVPQGSIRLPPTLTQNLTAEEQQLVSRVQFSFYQKATLFQDRSLGDGILNSGILGTSVANISITDLQDDIIISLRHLQPVPANYVATCAFWDFSMNDKSGGWNPRGCHVQNSTDDLTICGCNHLTSFGILLVFSGETITNRTQATILTFITYIGCGVSAIFLAITLLTYIAFGKLRKDIPSKILIHLCLALLLLNMVFLVDAWLALYPDAVGLCISTAWFLHYFLLVAFTWMGLEAVHMYIALVKVFNSHISHYMLKFSLAGWGIPMLVVIIVIAIDKDNYGLVSYGKFTDGTSDEFCWIKNDVAFYVAVVAYFCAIFLFNLAMFIVVLVQLCRMKKQNPHNVQHRTTLQDVRSVLGIAILLGLTWGFAFFAWGPLNLPFMYLFAIFNSFQGFFIFIFHCAVKENVRRQWRTYLCCGKMRLAENSDWSRTATQKATKKSSVSRITSLQSSKSNNSSSSSSYLVSDSSDQTNGYGSPFPDNIITADEDPSMDVMLNELNSQYRRL